MTQNEDYPLRICPKQTLFLGIGTQTNLAVRPKGRCPEGTKEINKDQNIMREMIYTQGKRRESIYVSKKKSKIVAE